MNIGRLFIPTVLLLAILAITLKIVTTEDIEKVPTDPPTQSEKIDSGKAETNISPFSSIEEIPSTDEGTNITLISPKEGEIPAEFEDFLTDIEKESSVSQGVSSVFSAENPPPLPTEITAEAEIFGLASAITDWYTENVSSDCVYPDQGWFGLTDNTSSTCGEMREYFFGPPDAEQVNVKEEPLALTGDVIDEIISNPSSPTTIIEDDAIQHSDQGIYLGLSVENKCGTTNYVIEYSNSKFDTIIFPVYIATAEKMHLTFKDGQCTEDGTLKVTNVAL